jgi:predicted PurR-regulated permease PerM
MKLAESHSSDANPLNDGLGGASGATATPAAAAMALDPSAAASDTATPLPISPLSEEPAVPGTTLRFPMHVNARGMALGIIATVAFLYALQWSQKFLVPLLLGVFIAYTLNPVVLWLERHHVKRAVGSTLVTVAILMVLGLVAQRVQGEFLNIMEELPTITHKVTKLLTNTTGGQPSTIQQMQAAASEIEQATANVGSDGKRVPLKKPAVAAGSGFKIMDWVLAGSVGLATFASEATMVVFLVFFLLLSGDTFKRKLVKLTGPSLTRKKVTVHILDDINTSIQNYMFMLLVTNVLLALLMWAALSAIGLENAGAWAIFAGLMHIMPYFGPLLITASTGMVAFMQFESLRMVLLVAGASLAIATLVGTVVTTWMTGRIARMNPAAVFVSLLFWGWLWGMWGLLLGVPVVVIIKVVAERVEGMEVVAELLGE